MNALEQNAKMTDYSLEPVWRLPAIEGMIVPHYSVPHIWVGLGNKYYTSYDFIDTMANVSVSCIWTRPWTEKVVFLGKDRTMDGEGIKHLIKKSLKKYSVDFLEITLEKLKKADNDAKARRAFKNAR